MSSSSSSSSALPSSTTSLAGVTRPPLSQTASTTSTSSKRSFLTKLNPTSHLPRQLPKRLPNPLKAPFRQRRSTLFLPVDPAASPLGSLVIVVLAAKELVARDKNGTSDPFCVIRCGDQRLQGPTIDKNLNPVWAEGENRLEVGPLYESRGFSRERVEVVLWDKDRVGKQYLGEVSLGLDEWWGPKSDWKDGRPPVGLMDAENKPYWHPIRSTRRTSVHISGSLLVQIGFVPSASSQSSTAASKQLSESQRVHILEVLGRLDAQREGEGLRRQSKEERMLLTSPTEGVGTAPIEDHQPLGISQPRSAPVNSNDSDASSISSMSESGSETDSEDEATDNIGSSEPNNQPDTSTDESEDESDLLTAVQAPKDYFGLPVSSEPASLSPSRSPSASLSLAKPDVSVPESISPPPTPRRGLSLPGFMKRQNSSKSMSTSPTSSTVAGSTGGLADVDSALEADTNKKKKRFSRKKKASQLSSTDAGDTASSSQQEAQPKRRRRKSSARREKQAKKQEKQAAGLSKRGTKRDYRYGKDDGEMFGLVQIEVKGAEELPKYKNMTRLGWDMDPFCVVSFGKKVFRTRVIRHSLNPVWDEKLFFPVRRSEAGWIVSFNLYDWDKMSSNDHVGDVSIPLAELIGGSPLQPDERGLYAATAEGRLQGDEFVEHELKLIISDKEGEITGEPRLRIRAKFTPYDALRQQFLRIYLRQYDIDESGTFSHLEIFSMLDSLGSTLAPSTLQSFFTRFNKDADRDELSMDEVVQCLEHVMSRPESEKTMIDDPASLAAVGLGGTPSGANTPALGVGAPLGFGGGQGEELQTTEKTDKSANMETLKDGQQVTTNEEEGTVVQQDKGHLGAAATLSGDESSAGPTVERVINVKECPLCHKPRMSSKAELDIITHMGICSSTDPRSINRIVVGEYVTASQAQRKWFTKIISKGLKGAYQLGANSANIIVQDRQTGMLQEEKMAVYVRLGIRLMYKGMGVGGGMESARIRNMLRSMSVKQGAKFDSATSAREIAPFIAFHNLNMEEALDPISSFKTFNQFFYRKLKPGARPVSDPDDPNTVVSPADCRAMFFPTVDAATKLWIKGRDFSVSKLLGEGFKDQAAAYEGGSLAIFRLAPQDYHRYHSPVDGVMGPQKMIAGQYYTVNPMAIRSSIDIYGDNVRLVAPITSPVFGDVFSAWVGAMMVGSIEMTVKEGQEVKRGDEVGYFAFGGSTIVVLFPPKSVVFDSDLVLNSENSVETLVRMGSRIGRKVGA